MDNDKILVSIRCLVYNHESYLCQCLEGFVMQKTNFRFEAIVHDDASTDGSATIIREYAEKYPDIIKPIYETENQYSKHDGSLGRIMNAACKGKYIAFCEGDDYWIDPLKLQKQVDFLEENLDHGMVYGKAQVYNQIHNSFEKRIFGKPRTSFEDLMVNGNSIPTLTVMCRRHFIDEYNRNITEKWRMDDLPLWLFISYNSRIHFIDDKFGVYRKLLHSASSRESYDSAIKFYESAHECKLYFDKLYNTNLRTKIEDSYKKRMFLCAFSFKNWRKALEWYNLGFTKDYKNIIRYTFVKFKFLHKLGSFLIDKEVM